MTSGDLMLEPRLQELERRTDTVRGRSSPDGGGQLLSTAVEAVRRRLFRPTDTDRVLADFIEDDFREGLHALADVDAYFADLLLAIASDAPPADLVANADDFIAQERLEYLATVIAGLRRRIGELALRSRRR